MTPLQAIKKFCCSGGCRDSAHQARACQQSICELYPFRLGRNPNRARSRNFDSPRISTATTSDFATNSDQVGSFPHGEPTSKKQGHVRAPLPTIRAYCLSCCLGQPSEVAACPATGCALHPYRMGRKPRR